MTTRTTKRPLPSEYSPYYGRYIDRVADGDIVEILDGQVNTTSTFLSEIGEERAGHRYAPGKWSIREVVGHVIDSERVFACRALRFARSDKTPLPGFDESIYMKAAGFDGRSLQSLLAEFEQVRRSNVHMFRHLDDVAWERRGVANEVEVTVRALAYLIAGHELHHVNVIKERYLPNLR